MRSRLVVAVFAFLLTGVIASCEDNITSVGQGLDQTATWRANMDATQETPAPNLSGATNPSGRAWFVDNGTTLTYYMEYAGLSSNASNAHIHRGAPGAAGNAIVQLEFVTRQSGVVSGWVDMSLADVGLGAENISPDSLRTLLNNGNAYVNVHTTQNGAGEIRGQVRRR
jgi:hypothetical protein